MAAKTTYTVTLPDGTEMTRTSTRAYAFARIVDFGTTPAALNGRYMPTFHATRELADRPHTDFKWASYTVVPVQIATK